MRGYLATIISKSQKLQVLTRVSLIKSMISMPKVGLRQKMAFLQWFLITMKVYSYTVHV